MASKWTTLSLPFVGGIDTKTDGKLLPPPKLKILENGVFAKHGTVRHRHGYDVTLPQTLEALDIDDPVGLATRNDELLLAAGGRLYSYDPSTDRYADTGPLQYLKTEQSPLANTNSAQEFAEVCTYGGCTVAAWEDSRGGVRLSAYSASTGAPFVIDVLVDADGRAPALVVVDSSILLVYYRDSSFDIRALRINPIDPVTSASAPTVEVRSNASATLVAFDVVSNGTTAALIYATDMVTEPVHLALLTAGGSATSSFPVIGPSTVQAVAISMSVSGANYNIAIAVEGASPSTSDIYIGELDTTTPSATIPATDLYENERPQICRLTMGGDTYFWEETAAEEYNHIVKWSSIAGAEGSIRHSKLASSGFTVGDATFVHVLHESPLQSTYFLVRSDSHLCGRYNPGLAADGADTTRLPKVQDLGNDQYAVALRTKRRLDLNTSSIAGSTGYTHDNFKRTVHTFNAPDQFHAVQSGGATYVAGGLLWQYDGDSPVESGFLLYPENGSSDLLSSGSPAIPNGTYNYRVYYEWTNGAGERERSSAVPFQVVNAAGSRKVEITIPTLAHTLKTGARSEVALVVYRTESLGSSYYRCSSADPTATGDNGWVSNDTAADEVVFVDNMTDAVLRTREPDYQNSGEFDNVAPDSGTVLAATNSRLFLAGGTIPSNTIYASKVRGLGQPAGEFNGNITLRVPEEGGAITAIGEINGALIVFKRDRIYITGGEGPNDLGGGSGFEPARLLASDVGCSKPRTVVLTPMGLMFVSQRGIYLVNTSQGAQYIGAEVEGYNSQNYVSASAIPDQSIVVFLTDAGATVVYDYLFNQWSTWTNHAGIGAALWDTTYCYLRADGSVARQSLVNWTDGGVPFSLHMRTAPIRPPELGIQEHWRLRRAMVLGDYYSPHELSMGLIYDRDDFASETVRFVPADVLNLSTWGEDGRTWGETGYLWGGSGSREYQFELRVARQKCETVAFDFYDIPGATPGAGYELTELALEWAPKSGLTKQPATRKV